MKGKLARRTGVAGVGHVAKLGCGTSGIFPAGSSRSDKPVWRFVGIPPTGPDVHLRSVRHKRATRVLPQVDPRPKFRVACCQPQNPRGL